MKNVSTKLSLVAFAVMIFSVPALADGQFSLLDQGFGFVAPTVPGTSSVADKQSGMIILDSTSGNGVFKGLDLAGNWQTIAPLTYPRSEIFVYGGGGYGSTNTGVRHYSQTPAINTGTAITYTASTTNGDSFTINTAGVYSISICDVASSTSPMQPVITRNSTSLTGLISTTDTSIISGSFNISTNASVAGCVTSTTVLSSGDVIRAQDANSLTGSSNSNRMINFHITQVSN